MGIDAQPSRTTQTEIERLHAGRAVIRHEAQALLEMADVLDARFTQAVERVFRCQGSVIVTGVGKAGLIGSKIVATLSSTGTRSHFLHPAEAVHGDLGCVHSKDIVLALSNSGETEEICRLLPVFEHLQVPVIAITAEDTNTLAQGATIVLPTGRLREAGQHGLAPTTSTTAMLALGDALALVVSRARGFTQKDFARLHPAGSLGRRLKTVGEVMRRPSELRIARETATIREVMVATGMGRPSRRTGAVILVDPQGCVSGLFTDSDLVRLIEQRRESVLDGPISDSMTSDPLVVTPEIMLTDAVKLLSDRKISELPVVDSRRQPIGLVDITDVISLVEKVEADSSPSSLRIADGESDAPASAGRGSTHNDAGRQSSEDAA